MDRRREQRIPTDQTARVTVFGTPDQEMPSRILDVSEQGMRLLVDRTLPLGTAVKVETEDALVLGEVCYSAQSQTQTGFEVGLEVMHSLVGLKELARLNRRLLDGWYAPASLEDEVAARRR